MEFLRPRSVREALETFQKTPGALALAGGTDFMVGWNMGLLNGKTVVDLSRIAEWKGIEAGKTGVRIGSLVTHAELQRHPLIRREFPLLVEACALIGAIAIQNRGTIGGNIANASPAADTFPSLAVYEAVVHTASPQGRRAIPFLGIFAGPKKTHLRPGELIEAIEIPYARPRPSAAYFRKVGTRAAQALSKTVAAGLLWLSRGKTVAESRFALGSVAPTIRRARKAEDYLRGRKLTAETVGRAMDLVEAEIAPIDDVRSTAAYRFAVSKNLLKEFLECRPR
jgi:CO/xanthine dehydrogenase FAD-binding subunit